MYSADDIFKLISLKVAQSKNNEVWSLYNKSFPRNYKIKMERYRGHPTFNSQIIHI